MKRFLLSPRFLFRLVAERRVKSKDDGERARECTREFAGEQRCAAETGSFTAGADPRADVVSATQKLQKLEFWSATVTSETSPEAKAEMEFIAPDRYHIKRRTAKLSSSAMIRMAKRTVSGKARRKCRRIYQHANQSGN